MPAQTVPLPFNATADVVRSALEALPGVGPVEVRRKGPTALNEYEWKITWDWGKDSIHIRGDVNSLIPEGFYLGGRWTGMLETPLYSDGSCTLSFSGEGWQLTTSAWRVNRWRWSWHHRQRAAEGSACHRSWAIRRWRRHYL